MFVWLFAPNTINRIYLYYITIQHFHMMHTIQPAWSSTCISEICNKYAALAPLKPSIVKLSAPHTCLSTILHTCVIILSVSNLITYYSTYIALTLSLSRLGPPTHHSGWWAHPNAPESWERPASWRPVITVDVAPAWVCLCVQVCPPHSVSLCAWDVEICMAC